MSNKISNNDDIYPKITDIKPYVAVGPSKDLSITVHKETFDKAFMALSIVMLLAALILIGVMIWASYTNSSLPPPPPPIIRNSQQDKSINSNYGAAYNAYAKITNNDGSELTSINECLAIENTKWIEDKCLCKEPFFGPLCNREKHHISYFSVGIHDDSSLNVDIIDNIISDGKSFNDNSCSNRCDLDEKCIGFIYNVPNMCTLLKNDVIVNKNSNLSYSNNEDSTLYLKNLNNLKFNGKIFLAKFKTSVPSRYWLIKEKENYIQFHVNIITKISFAPSYIKIYGQYTGIYCLYSFTYDDINIIYERGSNSECYIHHPGTSLNLPLDWEYKSFLYVIYI